MRSLLIVLALCVSVAHALQFGPGANFSVDYPSFLALFPRINGGEETLWITEFTGNPFAQGKVSYVDDIASYLDSNFSNVNVQLLYEGFAWPNLISLVPPDAINTRTVNAVLIPDGFLVPGKTDGAIWFVETDVSPVTPVRLDHGRQDYFYHMAIWRDMNNDGLLDVLTARATKPLFSDGSGELLWLEQPSSGDPLAQAPWNEHVITAGPDVFFVITGEDTTANTFQLAAAQFFTSQVGLYEIDSKTGELVSQSTLESDDGPFQGIVLADLNGDGKQELVVNSHVAGSGGSVYGYVSTKGDNTFDTRVTLATGFPVTVSGFNSASPGLPYVFQPAGAANNSAPYILLAGDDAGDAYLLTPTSTEFQYSTSIIRASDHTCGSLGISASGKFIMVPDYEGNTVQPFYVDN